MGKGERPEHQAPAEVYYNDEEAAKYTQNSRIMAVQAALARRAIELLALPSKLRQDGRPRLLLDLGCGSGLSGAEISAQGHVWLGTDISSSMLEVAQERDCEGDLMLHDLGHGLPLRAGIFDGAVSISAVQWLCNADKSSHDPRKRLRRFFETLYASLIRGARAVLQIYPENPAQAEMIVGAAMRAGFSGGLVVDYPHSTRARKHFLVLMVGTTAMLPSARGVNGDDEEASDDELTDGDHSEDREGDRDTIQVAGRERRRSSKGAKRVGDGGRKPTKGSRDWVVKKKETMRKRGYEGIPKDTKYTGRKRKRLGL